jgi:hypothetical protein
MAPIAFIVLTKTSLRDVRSKIHNLRKEESKLLKKIVQNACHIKRSGVACEDRKNTAAQLQFDINCNRAQQSTLNHVLDRNLRFNPTVPGIVMEIPMQFSD